MEVAIVVIGASLGGLKALKALLGTLPKDFPLPLAIVQHRGKEADETLTRLLREVCALPVSEVRDKDRIVPGHLYVAPSDYHLLVERGWFALSTEAPVNYARPSIDVLFESAADTYGDGVIGVILTGSSEDGTKGAARIKARGGSVIVQDPATAEAPAMPSAAIAAAPVDRILPLSSIAAFLMEEADQCRASTPTSKKDKP